MNKIKKLFLGVLSAIMVLCACIGLAACSGGGNVSKTYDAMYEMSVDQGGQAGGVYMSYTLTINEDDTYMLTMSSHIKLPQLTPTGFFGFYNRVIFGTVEAYTPIEESLDNTIYTYTLSVPTRVIMQGEIPWVMEGRNWDTDDLNTFLSEGQTIEDLGYTTEKAIYESLRNPFGNYTGSATASYVSSVVVDEATGGFEGTYAEAVVTADYADPGVAA